MRGRWWAVISVAAVAVSAAALVGYEWSGRSAEEHLIKGYLTGAAQGGPARPVTCPDSSLPNAAVKRVWAGSAPVSIDVRYREDWSTLDNSGRFYDVTVAGPSEPPTLLQVTTLGRIRTSCIAAVTGK
ncbi:hypothetical protein [Dactylosporangium matsuzakiense]|uniref:hypothetical protein n=1 Tax=Dactylosporangium matsuzakiense TaxID=53360 RepID=UPI0021C27B12|nr:hypothetical protein [Dactylosporangium matsuzakiense]UWZ45024.1 hypothetical protein Dmats_00135 [Dactylosporangium matsuzakiense]